MKLNRELQKRILDAASDNYPRFASHILFNEITSGYSESVLLANIVYLEQHGLIKENSVARSYEGDIAFNPPACTHKGMDFLAEDGGLGAILNTVTVKLHEDTLREMIESKILQSDLPKKEKETFVQSLKKLPADSIKHLTMKLLDKGVESSPAILALIVSCLR